MSEPAILAPSPETASADETPTVSLVIPTFNYARFLPDALDSVFAQQDAAVEVIVVDDGSSDAPAEVVARYPGVRLIEQQNRGLPAARNAGLAAAAGEYIAFLDADDRLLPGAVAAWLKLFEAHLQCGFVHGSYRSVDSDWRQIWQPEPVRLGDDAFAMLLAKGNLVGMGATVLFRTDRLRSVGGFDEQLRANEDYDLYLRLLRRYPAASTDQVVAEYRHHHGNMSRDAGLMMSTGTQVIDRQRDAVRGSPDLGQALREGRRGMQRYWVRSHLRELVRGTGGRSIRRQDLLRSVQLLVQAPGPFLKEGLAAGVRLLRRRRPAKVRWGSLRRSEPVSRDFGYDRGTPIDRH